MSLKPEKRAPMGGPGTGTAAPSPWRACALPGADGLAGLMLLCATLAAYAPVWRAGFIWDDDGHVTRADLRPLRGLWRIWSEPGATQQYYPLLHSAFWLEHRLWGDSPLGYHLANIVLHAAAAFLLYRVLRTLRLPGALLGASAFALHPVCVESVAWISEQKNTLSAVFYMAAALAYLRFDGERRARWYVLASGLFLMALATKSVTATLPAALLVVLWWRRGRLSGMRDVLPLAPWLCMGAAAGLVTAWVERTYIGASGAPFRLGVAERFLVAGRAIWFYLGKIVWPADLLFIYPRWAVDARAPWQYLFPAAAVAALAVLFALRRRSRGPIASALLFAGTLFPALGFVNVYPFLYSFVADHFQYLAAAVALSAGAAGLSAASAGLPRIGRAAAAACLVAGLAWLTSRQCAAYADAETIWRATIAGNPGSWMARENLGGVYMREGRMDQAVAQFQGALDVRPDDDGAMNELGVAELQEGRIDQAVALFHRALRISPDRAETHINLGAALLAKARPDEAAGHFTAALGLEPGNSRALRNLAAAYAQEGRWHDAAEQYSLAAEGDPGDAELQVSLGSALARDGRLEAAEARFRRALELSEGSSTAHFNLANALTREGKDDEAVAHLQRALQLNPGYAEAHNNLANELAKRGALDAAVAHFRRAVELDGQYAEAQFNLGNILLQLGQTDQAIVHLRRAAEIRPDFAQAHENLGNALLQEGRGQEATAELRAAALLEPGNAQVQNDLGVVLLGQGRADEAAAQYRKALEAEPGFAVSRINLGNLLLQGGDAAQAAEAYRKALETEPNNARVRNNLGIALAREGRTDEAAVEFKKAIEIDPDNAEARRNLSLLTHHAAGQ